MKLKKIKKEQGNMILAVLVIAFLGLVLAFPTQIPFLGSFLGSIIGTPFLSQGFSADWYPSCAYANCYDPTVGRMEGFSPLFGSSAGVFRSAPFAETDLGQNYDVRAVSCETGLNSDLIKNYVLGANVKEVGESSIHFVSQIQTKDGKWLDYYVTYFVAGSSGYVYEGGGLTSTRLTTVYRIPNSNEYTYRDSKIGEAIDLPDSIQSNKVRCRFESGWQVPRYGGSIKVNIGYLKVYGEVIQPSCFDGIKNQDETEIDYGGVCGVEELPVITEVCGNNFCGENESSSSCPTDCAVIVLEPTTEETGTHQEDVPGVGLTTVGNALPEGITAKDALIPVLAIGILASIIGIVYFVHFRK